MFITFNIKSVITNEQKFNFKTNKIDFDLDHMKINNDYPLSRSKLCTKFGNYNQASGS